MQKFYYKILNYLKIFRRSGRISTRFRIINVVLFATVSILISVIMLLVLQNITNTVSKDYAMLYSSNTAGILDTYFGSQIALVKKAAHSKAVVEWFADEDNQEKKLVAYEEMIEITKLLSSSNLYIGIEKSLHEYTVEENYTIEDIESFSTLKPGYYDDEWYFKCTGSDEDYQLNVDINKIVNRKRVWLNYKVTRGDDTVGVLCTWLEFSDLVEKLFSGYDSKNIRGLVIDEAGLIHMDSALLGGEDFLHYSIDDKYHVEDEFTDPILISAIKEYMEGIAGYFDTESPTIVIELPKGEYRYATIAPIAYTTWSVVTFYNASSLFSIANLLPLIIIIFTMLIIFMVATGFAGNRLVFAPLEKLTRSVTQIKKNHNESVYGIERRDEIGYIANSVQDMKDSLIDALDKVHYDALTGIYNRRFLDENLSRIIKSLSRSGGTLGVMMIDVDYFKKYNDTYGHDIGDACLKSIANALVSGIERADDFVARYGGEEFAIILPNTDENGARVVADRMLEAVKACKIPHEKNSVVSCVTISIGVTTGSVKHPQNGENYIKRADEALYISKQNGRNRYTFINIGEEIKNDR